MSVLRRLKAVPDPIKAVSPLNLREALAAALALAARATEAAEKVRGAVQLAERMVAEAETRHIAAVEAAQAARASHTADIVAAATSGEASPRSGALREARRAEADTVDDLDAAREALAVVREPLAGLEQDERKARDDAAGAASAIVYATIPDLTGEALDAYATFLDKAGALRGAVEATEAYRMTHYGAEPPERAGIRVDAQKVYMGLIVNRDAFHTEGGQDQEWRDAFQSLQADASSPLPFESTTALNNDAA